MNLRESLRQRREHPDLEITPLIDIVFLLLIFFLVTTSFSQASGGERDESEIPVQLPEAATGEGGSTSDRMVLYVQEDGSVELRGDVELRGSDLSEKLADLHERHPEMRMLLKGDEQSSHGRLIDVLDQLRASGFRNVNLVAREKK
jgi:biopolymer transport protein ExbD